MGSKEKLIAYANKLIKIDAMVGAIASFCFLIWIFIFVFIWGTGIANKFSDESIFSYILSILILVAGFGSLISGIMVLCLAPILFGGLFFSQTMRKQKYSWFALIMTSIVFFGFFIYKIVSSYEW